LLHQSTGVAIGVGEALKLYAFGVRHGVVGPPEIKVISWHCVGKLRIEFSVDISEPGVFSGLIISL
jgi:hypothetical protein